MRVGMNLLFLVPGEVGGSEVLLVNLTRAVAALDQEVVVFALRGFSSAHPDLAAACEIVEAPWSSPRAQGLRIAAEHTWLPVESLRRKLDVIHHGVGTTPFIKARPSVVTVHDIQYRRFPANFGAIKRRWLKVNLPYTVRTCEATTVPSRFVKQDLVSGLRADPERVHVVPFGSENLFGVGVEPASADEVRERYRLERPFFFFPGHSYPHKNHRLLIEAFRPIAAQADLIFTGPPWGRDAEIRAAAERLGLEGRVKHLGLVPRPHLAGLYRAAIALCYPSLFEGFGAPALEAMSLGCPVIASSAASLPEVVGEAGILLDPGDAPSWTEVMSRVASDPALRESLVAKGRARAAEFSWARSGALQVAAYEAALSGRLPAPG